MTTKTDYATEPRLRSCLDCGYLQTGGNGVLAEERFWTLYCVEREQFIHELNWALSCGTFSRRVVKVTDEEGNTLRVEDVETLEAELAAALARERELQREICDYKTLLYQRPQDEAKRRGWNCYDDAEIGGNEC